MKHLTRLTLAVALAASFAGCAVAPRNVAMLTFESKPEGATIYEGKVALGVAPVTRTYTFEGAAETMATPEVTAVWPSGAKAGYWTNLKLHADLVATIDRPDAAPGLAKDLEAAKPFIAAKQADEARAKDDLARGIKRDSPRCKEQQQRGNVATNDC